MFNVFQKCQTFSTSSTMIKHIQTCSNMLQLVQNCSNLYRSVKTCLFKKPHSYEVSKKSLLGAQKIYFSLPSILFLVNLKNF